jgi:cellulose synthase/poly-beta-1,6-N-acetylglucosamine synthase-like glycosyltransferase
VILAISVTLFFIVLRFTVTLFNFISNPKLTRVNRRYDDLVSILIPARNEQDKIVNLLESIYQQDYPHHEVIVYDDESTDETYQICSGFAESHPRFSVIKGSELPAGWLGKNHACDQLAKKATGKYFLFLDADDTVDDGLINSSVYRMQAHKLGLLSLLPNQVMITTGEKLIVPLVHFLLLNLFPVRLVQLTKQAVFSAACGQFMLFDAAVYRKNNWHRQVRNKVLEDVEIMKAVKSAGYNGEILLANNMISCRMYRSYREAINGFTKSTLGAFNNSVLAVLLYLLLFIGGPMIVLMTLNFNLISFMISLIILTRVMVSLSADQPVWYNVIFHPVQMLNLAGIALLSVQRHLTGTNVWKGRQIRG